MLKAEIIGNLGSSAKVVSINGKEFVSFTVAHSDKRNGQEVTTWVNILWYGNGGGLLQYLAKGVKVFVRGDLNAKVFTRRDGSQDISLSIMTRELQICQFEQHGQPPTNTHTLVNQTEQSSDDDDLPF